LRYYEKLIEIESDNPALYWPLGQRFVCRRVDSRKRKKPNLRASGHLILNQADHYHFKMAVLFQHAEDHREAERLLNKCIAASSAIHYIIVL